MNVILANFGDDSIALVQWAYLNKLDNCKVIYINTGWQSEKWQLRIDIAKKWLENISMEFIILNPEHNLNIMVKQRKNFPDYNFQWCSGFIKGLPILDWLDENDEYCEATILVANRIEMSKSLLFLEEYVEESEHFDERTLRFPLYNFDKKMRNNLIEQTPFKIPLNHRSFECNSCIHSVKSDFKYLTEKDISQIKKLENEIKKPSVLTTFNKENEDNYYDNFNTGCAFVYGCGL